jgi:hypothetical protein
MRVRNSSAAPYNKHLQASHCLRQHKQRKQRSEVLPNPRTRKCFWGRFQIWSLPARSYSPAHNSQQQKQPLSTRFQRRRERVERESERPDRDHVFGCGIRSQMGDEPLAHGACIEHRFGGGERFADDNGESGFRVAAVQRTRRAHGIHIRQETKRTTLRVRRRLRLQLKPRHRTPQVSHNRPRRQPSIQKKRRQQHWQQ